MGKQEPGGQRGLIELGVCCTSTARPQRNVLQTTSRMISFLLLNDRIHYRVKMAPDRRRPRDEPGSECGVHIYGLSPAPLLQTLASLPGTGRVDQGSLQLRGRMSCTQSLDTAATSVTGISGVCPLSEADPNRTPGEKAFRANDLTDLIANDFTSYL